MGYASSIFDIRVADVGETNGFVLLGAEFSLLPAKIVSSATSAPVCVWRVARPACPADLEK
jgi:hypothetical protein